MWKRRSGPRLMGCLKAWTRRGGRRGIGGVGTDITFEACGIVLGYQRVQCAMRDVSHSTSPCRAWHAIYDFWTCISFSRAVRARGMFATCVRHSRS